MFNNLPNRTPKGDATKIKYVTLTLRETKDMYPIHQNNRFDTDGLFFAKIRTIFKIPCWQRWALNVLDKKMLKKKTWRDISWSSIKDISGETTRVKP